MKKILLGLSAIAVVLSLVAGTAYALLTSNSATVSGISVTSGTAELQVWNGSTYVTDWNAAFSLSNLAPGYNLSGSTKAFDVWLKNNSTAAIALKISMGVTGLPGPLNDLAYGMQVQVNDVSGGTRTPWKSLAQLGTTTAELTGTSIAQGAERQYEVYFRLPNVYGQDEAGYPVVIAPNTAGLNIANEILGDTLSGVTLSFTGLQN